MTKKVYPNLLSAVRSVHLISYGGYLNFSTPIVAIFVLRKFHYD